MKKIWAVLFLILILAGCAHENGQTKMPAIDTADVASIRLSGYGKNVPCPEKDVAAVIDFMNQATYHKADLDKTQSATIPQGAIMIKVEILYRSGETETRTFAWQKIEGTYYEAQTELSFFTPFFSES